MTVDESHITQQHWWPDQREDGVYVVGADRSAILKLCRPDTGSDLLVAGYVVGLQLKQRAARDRERALLEEQRALRQALVEACTIGLSWSGDDTADGTRLQLLRSRAEARGAREAQEGEIP